MRFQNQLDPETFIDTLQNSMILKFSGGLEPQTDYGKVLKIQTITSLQVAITNDQQNITEQ